MKKPGKTNPLIKIRSGLLYCLPIAIFFSYHPVLTISENATMNLELSLILIWLIIFSIFSIPSVFHLIYNVIKNKQEKKFRILITLVIIFLLYATASIMWSKNFLRAVLTDGILWCLFLSSISIIDIIKNSQESIKKNLLKTLCFSSLLACLWCWIQSILDVFGADQSTTFMCDGCKTITFGFPHPNGFTAEPQYMGNLLLIPAFILLYQYFSSTPIFSKKLSTFFAVVVVSTLFLTLSRGAIYAFCLAYLFMALWLIIKERIKVKRILFSVLTVFVSFILAVLAQGIFSELSYTNDTFYSGIRKSLNQLSLGIIDLPVEKEEKKDNPETDEISSIHDGYIEASTNERMTLTIASLKLWSSNPLIAIFGVGIGSAGSSVNQAYIEGFYTNEFLEKEGINEGTLTSPKKIIQNEYVEILLEFGIIGFLLVCAIILFLIKNIKDKKESVLLYSIILSFGVSVVFSSGLPNALHIYLIIPLLASISANKKS